MDEDTAFKGEEAAHPHSRRHLTSGKVRTTDTYVTKCVQWPHEMVFTTQGQAPVYFDMSIALFTNGYSAVVTGESMSNKKHMLIHLQELMEDVEVYGRRIVREYHAAWLQLLEQGKAACGDTAK